jgi:hypothetical protein
MRKMNLLRMSVVALLAFGAMTAGAAAHKKMLVLKEEGKPVAVGTELGLEMGFTRAKRGGGGEEVCRGLTWRGHLSVNGAKEDKVTVEPEERECQVGSGTPTKEVRGSVSEVALLGKRTGFKGGKVTITGSLREVDGGFLGSPTCTYEATELSGELALPGLTRMGTGTRSASLVKSEGGECRKFGQMGFETELLGHNGKPLETELIG